MVGGWGWCVSYSNWPSGHVCDRIPDVLCLTTGMRKVYSVYDFKGNGP